MAIVKSRSEEKLLLVLLAISFVTGLTNCTSVEKIPPPTTSRLDRILLKRSHDKDFAPKLMHQPHSVSVKPNEPHTSECPVESQPESDVKWFKDNKLLENEPMHLEQTGSELMFFLVNDKDTGDYHCEATNYLGTVTSEQFRLTVQTSILDESIALDPAIFVASEQQEQSAEFKCTVPASYLAKPGGQWRTASLPNVVSWRKNGKPLQVVWTDANGSGAQDESAPGDENAGQRQARFTARQGDRRNEFVLSVARLTRARDDNSTFTCLYKPDNLADSDSNGPEVMAHESRGAQLRVESAAAPAASQPANRPVRLDIPMGPPAVDLSPGGQANGRLDTAANSLQNQTTQLSESFNGKQRIRSSLRETLADLYEMAKPTILLFGSMSLVAVIVLIQLLLARRRSQANRYMKHHHHQYSSASSSSANSNNGPGSGTSAATLAGARDPVLASLLSRTLSAPSASSLSVNAGKKYKFYRDHMRKVAAAITHDQQLVEGADFIDASTYFSQQHNNHQNQLPPSQLFAAANSAFPNLYNQSLAAREQAHSLLHTNGFSEHMRSMGNLTTAATAAAAAGQHHFAGQHEQQKSFAHSRDANHVPHNLELPLSFGLNGRTSSSSSSSCAARHEGPLEMGASNLIGASNHMISNQLLQSRIAAHQQQQQQQHQRQQQDVSGLGDEHYQLVSCSSISPSSTSSIVAGSTNSSSNKHCDRAQVATTTNGEMGSKVHESVSSNHYSTIDANEEEDDRYEELEQQQQQQRNTGEVFARNSARSSSASFGNMSGAKQGAQPQFQARKSTFAAAFNARANQSEQRASKFFTNQDQLSPYAVSSICNSLTQQRQRRELDSPAGAQAPPVTSEALQALNEQFDINHLLKFDQPAAAHATMAPPRLPFSLPPPPASNAPAAQHQQQEQSRHPTDAHQQ